MADVAEPLAAPDAEPLAVGPRVDVRIAAERFDPAAEAERLGRTAGTGAVASFLGVCRGEGGRLQALELEHYPGMAEAEIARIARDALARWPAEAILAVHRCGRVGVGEPIVLVAARAAHRDAAFDCVRYLMDFLKTDAPFWKREHLADGTVGEWVKAKSSDEAARARWA